MKSRNIRSLKCSLSSNILSKVLVQPFLKIHTDEFHRKSISRQHFSENTAEKDLYKSNIYYKLANIYKAERIKYEKFLLNELLGECGFNKAVFLLEDDLKYKILNSDIEILKNINFMNEEVNITDKLMSIIEPFPNKSICLKHISNNKLLTVSKIRNIIERHFLAWKLNADYEIINKCFSLYSFLLPKGRSLSTLKKNVDAINMENSIEFEHVLSKIYFLLSEPFTIKFCNDFNQELFETWIDSLFLKNLFLSVPFPISDTILNFLHSLDFTNAQIKAGAPYLKLGLKEIFSRVLFLHSHPTLINFKSHEKFLKLVKMPKLILNHSNAEEEILEFLNSENNNYLPKRIILFDFYFLLYRKLGISKKTFLLLTRHPRLTMCSLFTIIDTLDYLKTEYSKEEIIEALFIVLYPKHSIIKCINKIRENEQEVKNLGFVKSNSFEETNLFQCGTKSKNKTLQLCLYYLEKPHNFSGGGINEK